VYSVYMIQTEGGREKKINNKQIIIFYNELMILRYLFNDKLNIFYNIICMLIVTC